MFFADIEGHPNDRPVQLSLEELSFFSSEVKILGTYPASAYRLDAANLAGSSGMRIG
jgi:prephenate dehydratase